jgi:hypothetical protein
MTSHGGKSLAPSARSDNPALMLVETALSITGNNRAHSYQSWQNTFLKKFIKRKKKEFVLIILNTTIHFFCNATITRNNEPNISKKQANHMVKLISKYDEADLTSQISLLKITKEKYLKLLRKLIRAPHKMHSGNTISA